MNLRHFFGFSRLVLILVLFTTSRLQAQDFMMQGWYWDYPKTCDGFNWANTLQTQAADIGAAGFTYVWLPPMSRASFGSCSNGYDPQDLYDLGEYGGGATGFGTRTDVDNLITALNSNGVDAVADVVYNHRDGGAPETNPAVKDYITIHYTADKNPFPSDRFRCVLPLGGSSGNGAGDYYFKISSKSQSSRFHNKPYKVYMETSLVGYQNQTALTESEPNGGGDCGESFNTLQLGVDMNAAVDASGCTADEFKLSLSSSDFNAAGDQLIIYLTNSNGDYSDHRIYGLWNASAAADIAGQLEYQTYTDFTTMPSGQGAMNFENFSPNSANAATTYLTGDWDWLWFFYDYAQSQQATRDELFAWSEWLWNDVNIRGFRMDAVKHFDPAFVGDLMDHLDAAGIDPGMVVGEFFDGNAVTLKNWVSSVESNMNGSTLSNIDVRVFDFALRQSLKDACDQFGYDARNVFNSGVVNGASGSGFNAVTFINNHDFRSPGEPLQNDPMLAYAYILTNNQVGLPAVFYPDYYGVSVPNAPTQILKPQIDQLINIHQQYIFESSTVDYLSRLSTPYSASYTTGFPNTTLLYQLSGGIGGKEVVVVINFAGEDLVLDHQINMTNITAGDVFDDLTGNALVTTATFNGSNQLHLEVPARSYAVFVQNDVPAPVDLLSFTARGQNEAVRLDWKTAQESDLEGYVVERSLDGKNFVEVGWQKAENLAAAEQDYTFTDRPLNTARGYYYRLQIKEQNGSEKYSPVRFVAFEKKDGGFVFQPNPVEEVATISWENAGGDFSVVCYYASGQVIWSDAKANLSTGPQQLEIDMRDWPAGLYFLKINTGTNEWIEKVVKR